MTDPYGGTKEEEKRTFIMPTLSLATGIEYNYSKLFTRAEVEGRHAFREGIGASDGRPAVLAAAGERMAHDKTDGVGN